MGVRTVLDDRQGHARETRASLSAWQTPSEFSAIVEDARDRVGAYVIFRSPAWSFWRDAWIISRFAELAQAHEVQLTGETEQYPDGRVRLGGETLNVEATEAMMPGRKRANEYAPHAPVARHDPSAGWDNRLDQIPGVLNRVISKKARLHYVPKPCLVVYLNIGVYGDYRDAETRTVIASIKERYAGSFTGLYVLRGGELL
ncbi:hypothetical protein [Methylobacterium sp. Gmos1]